MANPNPINGQAAAQASARARTTLVKRHKQEFDVLITKEMEALGFRKVRPVTAKWEKIPELANA